MLPSRTHNYGAWLVPYAEGTLDPARAALLEAQLARDPALSAEAAKVHRVTAQLRQAAAPSTSEADPRLALDPASLWPGVQSRLALKPLRRSRPARWAVGVCAASLALAAWLLHGPLSGSGRGQTPFPAPLRLTRGNGAATPVPISAARTRHKKRGRRTLSRPTYLALSPSNLPMPAPPAVRPQSPPPDPVSPALPGPNPAAPSAHTAVALEDGSAHFRLASPVHDALPESRPRPASDIPAGPTNEDAPPPDRPAPSDTAPRVQTGPAPAQDSSAAAPSHARKAHRHRPRRRHTAHHHAVPPATPALDVSPAAPAAPAPTPRNPRIL